MADHNIAVSAGHEPERHLLVARHEQVMVITLNRPERRNAFSAQMIEAWVAALQEAGRDDAIRAVVITGAGSGFCAGGDLNEIYSDWRGADPVTQKDYLWRGIQRVPIAIAELDKPVIAAINGAATGAGLDMALACDIRIAAANAVLAESYVLVGLVPGDGGAFLLPRLIGLGRACELLFTGDPISAEKAEAIGLVNRVVPQADVLGAAIELAQRIASRPPTAIRLTKRLIYSGLESDLRTALDMSSSFLAHMLALPETGEAMDRVLKAMAKSASGKAAR